MNQVTDKIIEIAALLDILDKDSYQYLDIKVSASIHVDERELAIFLGLFDEIKKKIHGLENPVKQSCLHYSGSKLIRDYYYEMKYINSKNMIANFYIYPNE